MKARRHARKHPRKDRKFITQEKMRMIRYDVSCLNRHIKARGDQGKEYVSLHAWGCGCCFTLTKRVQPAPEPEPKLKDTMVSDTARYRVLMGG